MPECKDSRKCALRGTLMHERECTVLQEVYEDGKCPFCKERRTDINGFAHRPEGSKKKAIARKAIQKTDAYSAVTNRIQFVANNHGAYWRKELKFLEMIKAELEELAKLRDNAEWKPADEEPNDGQLILATVIEEDSDELEVRSGRYVDGEYEIDSAEDEEFYVYAWKPLCDPWEGAYETEEDTERNDAD